MGWRFVLVAIVFAGLVSIGYRLLPGVSTTWSSARSHRAEGRNAAAREPPPAARARVAALGRLAPRGEIVNVGAPEGDRLARLTVEEGQRVRRGEILAYLESQAERVAERTQIAARLAEATSRVRSETAFGRAVISESTARVRLQEDLPDLEIRVHEAKVRVLEAELQNSQRDLERVRGLRRQDLISQQELERQALTVHRNRLDLEAARVLLEKLQRARDLELAVAQSQRSTAEASLPRALTAVEIESLRASLVLAEARIERTIIRAPIDGRILKIIMRSGEATGMRPILQMGDTSHMYAIAEVYETDVGLVRAGQSATVTSPALSRPLTGRVEMIGTVVAKNAIVDIDPAALADRRVVEVKVRLDESEPAARLLNLQVQVEIDVGRR